MIYKKKLNENNDNNKKNRSVEGKMRWKKMRKKI